jgi:IS1 family transposase
MIAQNCQHESRNKHGKTKDGVQRYRCRECGKTFVQHAKPKRFGRMNIDDQKAVTALKMLLEGCSIRSTVRLSGVAKATVIALLDLVGWRARMFWEKYMRDIEVSDVQVDEIWGFVGMKEKTRERKGESEDFGDAWTFLGIERDSKLLLAFHVGKRTPLDANLFCEKLNRATSGRFQLSTDGFKPYGWAVANYLRRRVDYAQLIKIYGSPKRERQQRYSPAEIIGIRCRDMMGQPDRDRVCTSHAERMNLSVRMTCRRMTRLTNAFSKRWEMHEAALAFFFLWYNFCRRHQTLKTTPAVAHGIAAEPWTLERLLDEMAVCDE